MDMSHSIPHVLFLPKIISHATEINQHFCSPLYHITIQVLNINKKKVALRSAIQTEWAIRETFRTKRQDLSALLNTL
jgi:hypothetical protein